MTTDNENKMIADFIDLKYGNQRSFDDGKWTYPFKMLNSYFLAWNWLIPILKEIGEKTGYELVMKEQESYWNKEGHDPLNKIFGGYCQESNVRQAIVELITFLTNTQDDNH